MGADRMGSSRSQAFLLAFLLRHSKDCCHEGEHAQEEAREHSELIEV